jgi:carboxymethylenebutenolidase
VDHDVKEYPAVGHSFVNRHDGWKAVVERVGFRFADAAAEDAWARITGFFGRHLEAAEGG